MSTRSLTQISEVKNGVTRAFYSRGILCKYYSNAKTFKLFAQVIRLLRYIEIPTILNTQMHRRIRRIFQTDGDVKNRARVPVKEHAAPNKFPSPWYTDLNRILVSSKHYRLRKHLKEKSLNDVNDRRWTFIASYAFLLSCDKIAKYFQVVKIY